MVYSNKIALLWFALLLLLVSGCSSVAASNLQKVTPLPPNEPTAEPAEVVVASPTSVPTPSPTATPRPADPPATPTPLALDLPLGSAAAIAAATDEATKPTVENPLTFSEVPVPLTFAEFYDGFNLREGLILSDKLLSLDGVPVTIEGYMAPPLKAELDFFVLTRVRLAYCPFCSSAADWPDDIAVVYLLNEPVKVTDQGVRVTGRLEVGPVRDEETGMVSLVRIYAEQMEVVN